MPIFGSKTQVEMATISSDFVAKVNNMVELMKVNIRISREEHMATKRVEYKEMKSTFIKGLKIAMRVSKLGQRSYRVGGKTSRILEDFEKKCRRLEDADFKLKIMLAPVLKLKVEDIVDQWLYKTLLEDKEELEKKLEKLEKMVMDSKTGKQ